MPAITATLITAAKLLLKQIAKEGLKKAAKSAVKQGVKKVAKSVTKKGIKKFAKRKAKDFAKRKAKDFLRGKKKGEEGTQQERGGEIIRRDSDAIVKFVGGKPAKGGTATLAPGGGKTSFGEINEKIDNIVGLTSSIDAIVKSQYKGKKDEIKELRKDREDRRKRMRESLLESKKGVKKSGSGTEGAKDKKGDPLGWLTAILIGTVVLGLVNAISTLKKIMDTLGLNLHQIWLIIRYVPQALGKAFGNALKFIKNKGGKLIQGIKNKFGKVFKGAKDKIVKGFQKIAQGIKGLAQGLWKRIANLGGDLLKAGPKVLAKMGQGFKAVRQVVGGGIRKATAGVRRFIGRGGRKFLKSTASNINKVKNIAIKGFRSIKNGAIKGFNTLKGVAAKGVTRLKSIGSALKQSLKRAAGGIVKGAKSLVKGAGKAVGGLVGKLFPKMAGPIGNAKPLFKGLSKAAKGIKIPIIGPLIVGVTSLMSGDNIEKTLFKTLGTAIGGMIGLSLGPLGAIAGELLGETIGELMYVAFRDPEGGMKAAGELLKKKWQNALKTGTKIKDWITGGFKRFIDNFLQETAIEIPEGGGRHSAMTLAAKALGLFDWLKKVGYVNSDDRVYKFPNILQLVNPFKMLPLLKDSFFPPGGEKSAGGNGAELGSSGGGDKVEGVDQSASYEDGAEEEIVVPFPGGQQESSQSVIVSRGGMMRLGSSSRSAIDTMQKEKHLAALY